MQQRRTGTEWAQAIISWQPSWPLARNGSKPSLYGNPDCRSRLYELPAAPTRLLFRATLSTGKRMARGVTSASAAPWSTRGLAQPRTVPLLRGTDHFPLRSNSKSGNTDYASFGQKPLED